MRLILDTDVIVAGMRSPDGASAALIDGGLTGKFKLLVSVAMMFEYEAVLSRDEHRIAGVDQADADRTLDAIIAAAEPVDIAFQWRPQLRDPGDEMLLEAAINGQADGIVTFNRRDFSGAGRFGIPVWLPRECMERVRHGDKE